MKYKYLVIITAVLFVISLFFYDYFLPKSKDASTKFSNVLYPHPTAQLTHTSKSITRAIEIDEDLPVECPQQCESNCDLFPVSKKRNLGSGYIPEISEENKISNTKLKTDAQNSLNELLNLAKNGGINAVVISSFRSYQTQQSLFQSYVKNEMVADPKLNNAGATKRANVYSALPGQSEHQLGTTVDLNCSGCEPFASSPNSQRLYDFIVANSFKYGFVVSYPKNTQQITGYKHEPWHIRYIGRELAEEYINEFTKNESFTLEQFLIKKCES